MFFMAHGLFIAQEVCFIAQRLWGAHGLDEASAVPLIASASAQDETRILNRLPGFILISLRKWAGSQDGTVPRISRAG